MSQMSASRLIQAIYHILTVKALLHIYIYIYIYIYTDRNIRFKNPLGETTDDQMDHHVDINVLRVSIFLHPYFHNYTLDYYYYYYYYYYYHYCCCCSIDLCQALVVFFCFLSLYTVGRAPRPGVSSSQDRYLHTTTQTSIPRAGFEPKPEVFEPADSSSLRPHDRCHRL
jgi:hypothetical protein